MPHISERDIQSLISDWLSLNKIVHWRQNSGAIVLKNTSSQGNRFIKFLFFLYPKGDALAFHDLAGIYQGTFFSIECKKPRGKPTTPQNNTINLINSQGGLSFCASSVEEVNLCFSKFFLQKFYI